MNTSSELAEFLDATDDDIFTLLRQAENALVADVKFKQRNLTGEGVALAYNKLLGFWRFKKFLTLRRSPIRFI
jgi:hypothetical protein